MHWTSAISARPDTGAALEEATSAIRRELPSVDLVVVFASMHHSSGFDRLPVALRESFGDAVVVGCSAGGVIGDGREVENRPALSLTAAKLPEVTLHPFHVDTSELPEPADGARYRALVGATERAAGLLVLAEPFTCDVHALLEGLDVAFPTSAKFGGLASGGRTMLAHRLFLSSESFRSGAVGVAFTGKVAIDTLVAQGCRPIGTPMLITEAFGNRIVSLNQKPPLQVLRELYASSPARDQELFRHSLFLGVEMKDSVVHEEGELLVRNIIGLDAASGELAVAAPVKPFQVVQFLLRDARTAEEDLVRTLERHRQSGRPPPKGALLFSCVGRGQHLFGRPDHDSRLFQERIGRTPLGGFFCNGEIGPVGQETFLHGYTSAFALFRPR